MSENDKHVGSLEPESKKPEEAFHDDEESAQINVSVGDHDKPKDHLADASHPKKLVTEDGEQRVDNKDSLAQESQQQPTEDRGKSAKKGRKAAKDDDDSDSDSDDDLKWTKRSHSKPAIPRISRVDWMGFKNRLSTEAEEAQYAIEVLIGPPRYFDTYAADVYRWSKQKILGNQKPDISSSNRPDERISDPALLEIKGDPDAPERIRVNSIPILAILADIRKEPPMTSATVFLRPYVPILRYETEIRNRLEQLQKKWGHEESKLTGEDDKATVESDKPLTDDQGAQQNHISSSDKDASAPKTKPEGLDGKESSEPTVSPTPFDAPPFSTDDLTDSVEALRDLRCLVEFLDVYIKPTVRRVEDTSIKKIRFQDLGFLFKPGMDIDVSNGVKYDLKNHHSNKKKSPAGSHKASYQTRWRVLEAMGGRSALRDRYPTDDEADWSEKGPRFSFWISCFYIDWNGTDFAESLHYFHIKSFDGERDITDLMVFPAVYLESHEEQTAQLKARGQRFSELVRHGTKHMKYKGTTYTNHPCGCNLSVYDVDGPMYAMSSQLSQVMRNVTGEVIVDFAEAYRTFPFLTLFGGISKLAEYAPELSREVQEKYRTNTWTYDEKTQTPKKVHSDDNIFNDTEECMAMLKEYQDKDPYFKRTKRLDNEDKLQDLDEKDLVLLPSRVYGYVLRERFWAGMEVDNFSPTAKDVDIFDSLELPANHKNLVQSVVRQHFSNKRTLEGRTYEPRDWDVIEGKGRGLIILLHGVPGVGKTSTAECIAAANGLPLFPITCGDLGLTPENVERNSKDKFHLASLWNCLLLLDEADVFLAERDRQNLERNAMVFVFLRILEYYDGILFLTTNRVGVFDEAFKSRIHISLYYPALKKEQTISIWRKNLQRARTIDQARARRANAPEMSIESEKILEYAKKHFEKTENGQGRWNGRQIRNAFQTATALALYAATQPGQVSVLKVKHFKTVANVTIEFDRYIRETRGRSDADMAFDRMDRFDRFDTTSRHTEHSWTSPYPSHVSPLRDLRPQPTPQQNPIRFGSAHPGQYQRALSPGQRYQRRQSRAMTPEPDNAPYASPTSSARATRPEYPEQHGQRGYWQTEERPPSQPSHAGAGAEQDSDDDSD